MPPSDNNKVGVLITTVADNGALKTTQAELELLGNTAKETSAKSASAFDSFNNTLKKSGQEMSAAGRSLTTYISLPIAGVAAASVKMAMDFQQSMTYVRTDAGDTTDNINQMSQAVLNLAKTSQFGPDQLANGLYHLASLGLRGADAMKALDTTQRMAAVGGSNLEDTATALGGALVTGIKGVQDYSQAAGVLDATIGAGNMRMQDLVNAIGTGVLPVFKNAGLSITDFGAALATLTDNGQAADAAATHLRMTVALMEAPSKAAANVMESIGLKSNQLGMDMQTKGFIPALEDLKKHLIDTYGTTAEGKEKMATALTNMFGGGRSSAAIQTLVDQLDRVQTKYTQIGQQSGEFATKYAEQQQTAAAQFKTAWSGVQADMIQLGDAIMPSVAYALTDVAHGISNVTNWFNGLSKGQKQFVIDTAGVVAAVGPVLLVLGTLSKSISEILTLGGSIGGGLGGIFGAIGGLGSKAGSGAASFGSSIASLASGWASSMSSMARSAAGAMGDISKSTASTGASWAKTAGTMVKDSASATATMAGHAAKTAAAWIKNAHNSEIGLGGTLIKMVADSAKATGLFVKNAAMTSGAWIKSAALTSAAWVKSAAVSSYAWVTQTLPAMIKNFALTAESASKNAVLSSVAWVKNAAVSSVAWVIAMSKAVIAQSGAALAAIKNGLIAGAQWVLAAGKVAIYEVALDLAKTKTYLFGAASVATFATVGAAIGGAIADAYLLVKAYQSVTGAFSAVSQEHAAGKYDAASIKSAHDQIVALSKNGNADQKARANKLLHEGYASGGFTGRGPSSQIAGVVHKGEYVVPASQVNQSTGTPRISATGGITINQTNNNYRQFDLTDANRRLGWQLATMVG